MSDLTEVPVAYFGKIPARGDFVKSPGQHQLISTLDEWLARGMELLADDTRWKIIYENVQPMRFAFLGAQSRLVLGGFLVASCDASQRRFPFLTVMVFEVEASQSFMARSPLVLNAPWLQLERLARNVLADDDPASSLQALGQTTVAIDLGANAVAQRFASYLDSETLASLAWQLGLPAQSLSVRRLILALGILLQPVMTSGASHLDKGLHLPLPADPVTRSLVATFWTSLVTPFLTRADFEVVLFDGCFGQQPGLIIGFSGASPKTLQSVFDPAIGAEHNIRIHDAEWVEAYLDNHYGLAKLSSYLDQGSLSLRMVLDTFLETFVGA